MGKTDLNYRQPSYFEQLKKKEKARRISQEGNSSFNASWMSPPDDCHTMTSSSSASEGRDKQSPTSIAQVTDLSQITQRHVDASWAVAKESCKVNPKYIRRQLHTRGGGRATAPPKRVGWKTVRLFVSSTFHDFQAERDLLVKKVFPDLKAWCFEQKIHLVEIDLRWGVPQGADAEVALRTCLGEIERCYSDNGLPFFLNMQSERVGWLPLPSQVPQSIRDEFDWVDGLSITEMEVLQGAIRSRNPNAFFLIRHPSFLQTVPQDKRKYYQEGLHISSYKSIKFREVLDSLFGQNQKVNYYARYDGEDAMGYPQLTGYEDLLAQQVLDFFKMRIMAHYPMGVGDSVEQVNEWEKLTDMHETFMHSEAGEIGKLPVWDKQIADLIQYVADEATEVPYLLQAKSGSGKSSCLSTFITRVRKSFPDAKVFCHFVGAVPGSINYKQLVKRIAHFLGERVDGVDDLNVVVQSVCRKLSSHRAERLVIVIDAYNQLTDPSTTWLPYPLSPMVKVVITARPESEVTELMQKQYPKPLLTKQLIPMDEEGKREMVSSILGNYNKQLDPKQMDLLLSKHSSSSYYWLSLACEELRIYGHFSKLTEKIEKLPDDLVDLQCEILKRLEDEQPQEELLVAALCLLLVSQSGLLEIELLELLAEPPNLLPKSLREGRYADKLPYKVWSEIMRDLRNFVKSMGDPSEGRLKIYHATFGKAVEKFYFDRLGETAAKQNYAWFHQKLANYFKAHSTFERRTEEYPYHLASLHRTDELAQFLCSWDTINSYYQPRFSKHLSHLWSAVDSEYSEMSRLYVQKTEDAIRNVNSEHKIAAADLLKLADICYQNGRYPGCNEIIAKIENASTSISQLLILDDIQSFTAELKYIQAKSIEKSAQVKDVLAKAHSDTEEESDEVIKALMDALDSMNKLDSVHFKRKSAELENRIGMFYMTKLFALENSSHKMDEHDEANFRERAIEWVNRAQKSYRLIEDQIGIADTFTSLGVCSKERCEKIRNYETAEEIIGSEGGAAEEAAIGRLYMNLGIYYELDGSSIDDAVEYYEKYLDNSLRLFGIYHPETKRAQHAVAKLSRD